MDNTEIIVEMVITIVLSIAHHAVAKHLASVEEDPKSDAIDPRYHCETMEACQINTNKTLNMINQL